MKNKVKVLAFNRCYLPGYRSGGPIRTLVNMVDRIGDEFDFGIITLDRDTGDDSPYPHVLPEHWFLIRGANVLYLSRDAIRVSHVSQLVARFSPDVIYLNSYFDPIFTLRVLWARRIGKINRNTPIVLAPRGEFSDGALDIKYWRKRIYIICSKICGLYDDVFWQASSVRERFDILNNFPKLDSSSISVAMDLAPVVRESKIADMQNVKDYNSPIRVCFLSRIVPMKNLDYALKVLAKVRVSLNFIIYGPKEDRAYWSECESLIEKLPQHIEVKWMGEVHPSKVIEELAKNDLFFLPTRGENYGHVILEALSAGLPVLLSDQTPWGEVADKKVGWCFALDRPNNFVDVIESVATWEPPVHLEISSTARRYALEKSIDKGVLEANRNMFLNCLIK